MSPGIQARNRGARRHEHSRPSSRTPAGGAALDQIILATAGAMLLTGALLFLGFGHRSGRVPHLGRVAGFAERVSGRPAGSRSPRRSRRSRCSPPSSDSSGTSRSTSTRVATTGYSRMRTTRSSAACSASSPRASSPASSHSSGRRGARSASSATGTPAGGVIIASCQDVRADRLPARRRLAPPLRPGRDPVGRRT